MSKKVLIITYFFPPRQSIASVRLKGIAKYLPQFGWEPVILTPKLYGDVDPAFNIIQTSYSGDLRDLGLWALPEWLYNNKLFWEVAALPDSFKNWRRVALKFARDYLRENKVDAILSSSSPETVHLIAKQLKQEFNIPWVADMRDLWSNNQDYKYSNIRLLFDKLLEKQVLSSSNAITTVSQPLVDIQSSFLKSDKIYNIPNGFDPDNFKQEDSLSDKFNLTYAGKIYEKQQRSDYLFQAMKELIEEELISPNDVRINFWGPVASSVKSNVHKYKLESVVNFCGTVSHEKILEEQRKSQLLFYMNWEDESQKGIYLGKIFEYLCSKRPILVTGGFNNVTTELIATTNAGKYVRNDINELKKVILDFYNEYKLYGKIKYTGIDAEIMKFSHVEMADKFAQVLNNISECSDEK